MPFETGYLNPSSHEVPIGVTQQARHSVFCRVEDANR